VGRGPRHAARGRSVVSRRAPSVALFDDLRREPVHHAIRRVAFRPLAAYVAAQVYFTILPLFHRPPGAGLYIVALALIVGAVLGLTGSLRILIERGHEIGGAGATLLAASIILSLLCAWTVTGLPLPPG
jgi:hypothetical protein